MATRLVINIFRNKEIQILLSLMSMISVVGVIFIYFFSPVASLIGLVICAMMIGSFLFLTKRRYSEINRLSHYLRQISSGDFSLDIRDNYEGELSILKSEIYKVTKMLSEQRSELQQDKMKLTNAISDISHQLKTPLTSMMVMTDLLSDDNLPEEKRAEFTHNIQKQLERIEWLVSSLLKLSKIDAGTVSFKKDVLSVAILIEKALDPLLIPMDIKQQTITVDGEKDASFIGDMNWTVEAIVNILKNCVEHTPEGGAISISYAENALFTEIIIADSGQGIAKEDLPYLFQRFYKGKNASEDSIGIGLAMAHRIVTSQGGSIEVNSVLNQGTTFHIKFYKQII